MNVIRNNSYQYPNNCNSLENNLNSASFPSKTSRPYTFTIFSFTPPNGISTNRETFYFKPLNEKMEVLAAIIKKACQTFNSEIFDPLHKKIFVAPEDLFCNCPELGHKSYYSKIEKNAFKTTFLKVSEGKDIIIAPGTFYWFSPRKNGLKKYRNNLYLFYNGQIKHYNKHNPYISDFNFKNDCGFGRKHYNFEFFQKNRRIFHNKKEQPSLVEIGGIKIGVEICYDNTVGALDNYLKLNPEQKIDVHLLVSHSVSFKDAIPANQESSFIFIHVDGFLTYSTHHYKARAALGGAYISLDAEESNIIRQHYIYDGFDSKKEFFLAQTTPQILAPKRIIADPALTTTLMDVAKETAIIFKDPPQEKRIPRLMQIFNYLAYREEFDLLLQTITGLFSLDVHYLTELDESEDMEIPIEQDIRIKFSCKYINLLLDDHRVKQAITAAQQFLVLNNEFLFLMSLYEKFQIRKQFLAGITLGITLPREHQKNAVLRPFYKKIMSDWIDSPQKDLILANFSSILKKYGNQELALEWSKQ